MNPDLSGAIFTSSLSILVLNSIISSKSLDNIILAILAGDFSYIEDLLFKYLQNKNYHGDKSTEFN